MRPFLRGYQVRPRAVGRGVARGKKPAFGVFFGLEVLEFDFLTFSCCHLFSFLVGLYCVSDTAPRDRTNSAVPLLVAPPRDQLGGGGGLVLGRLPLGLL